MNVSEDQSAHAGKSSTAGNRLRAFILGNNSKHVQQQLKSEATSPRGDPHNLEQTKKEVLIDLTNLNQNS